MRTKTTTVQAISFDNDVAEALRAEWQRSEVPMSRLVNRVLRQALLEPKPSEPELVRTP